MSFKWGRGRERTGSTEVCLQYCSPAGDKHGWRKELGRDRRSLFCLFGYFCLTQSCLIAELTVLVTLLLFHIITECNCYITHYYLVQLLHFLTLLLLNLFFFISFCLQDVSQNSYSRRFVLSSFS